MPWHHSSMCRHRASLGPHWPATSASRPPQLEWVGGLWGCTHMSVRLKTCSHPMARLGTIKTNAISCWGFFMSPQAPTWERAVNCVCMIACTWNCMTTGQKSSNSHVALVDVLHRPTSVERSEKLLMLSLSVMEEKEPVS